MNRSNRGVGVRCGVASGRPSERDVVSLGASERAVGAGVSHEKRRWMRIFTISRLTTTQKTRRSVRTSQRRDVSHTLDPLHAFLLG